MSSPTPDTALLVMDIQPEIVDTVGEEVLGPIGQAIAGARQAGLPIIFVKLGFRPGYPEVSPSNDVFTALAQRGAFAGEDSRVHPAIAVVLSTLRAAADLDFRLVVLRDCCVDRDPEVHRVLLDKVFPRQAEVTDVQRWGAALGD